MEDLKKDKCDLGCVTIYEKQYDLLIHYSNRIFAARFATVTFVVLTGVYVVLHLDPLGVFPKSTGGSSTIDVAKITDQAGIWASLIVSVLWMMENGYMRKFVQIIISGKDLEKDNAAGKNTFFRMYSPFTHRTFYMFYAVTSLFFALRTPIIDSIWFWVAVVLPILVGYQMINTARCWVDASDSSDDNGKIGRSIRIILWGPADEDK